ncbi:MAG: DUF4339 domain-containing protein [Planctomycetaceae bacterium]|nr:DUF4339 domain-containing protein [Planctomycetaceae bacterium]
MAGEWYYLIDGEQLGPIPAADLKELADSGVLQPSDLVWKDGMPDWKPAGQIPGLLSSQPPPVRPGMHRRSGYEYEDDPEYRQFINNKVAAGLCGILLGSLGIHKFLLGMTTPGIIMLLITLLTCGMGGAVTGTIGLIEGILYLTKSDEEFYELYAIEKREWF